MNIIAVKLVSGQEIICCVDEHSVDFGIKAYPGKIPRKVFRVQETADSKEFSSHFLSVKKVLALAFYPGHGPSLIPFMFATPRFSEVPSSVDFSLHSNDVSMISHALDGPMLLSYRQLVGLISQEQLAPQNHSEVAH